jgi:hypothetical protein
MIDPLTMFGIGAATNLIGGIAGYRSEKKALDKQIERANLDRIAQEKAASAARAGLPGYSLGRGAREAYMMSQQDKAGDILLREQQRTQGAGLGALQAGGAKSLIGGASGMARQSSLAMEEILANQQARRAAGQQKFATAEQNILDQNVADQRELGLFDYGRALGLGDQARVAGEQARGMRDAAKANLFQDVLSGIGGAAMMGASSFGEAKDGAKIKETPGEFSHESNPIDLIRNGKKIGEATGGELIFNPEQSGKIEQLASDGDTPLHKYLRTLFKKFNSKK